MKNTIFTHDNKYIVVNNPPEIDGQEELCENKFGSYDHDKPRCKGYIEEKMINGCGPYLYLRYRDDGYLRSLYLGKKKKTA